MNKKELGARLIVAGLGIPLIMGFFLFGKILTVIAVAIMECVALYEFYKLYKNKGFFPNMPLGIGVILILAFQIYFFQLKYIPLTFLVAWLCIIIPEMYRNKLQPIINASLTVLGIIHLSFLSSLILIREFPKNTHMPYITGGWLVMQIFITIWLCDTAAYFWGSKFGKHRLFKKVSPKKTWEGAIAGFMVSIPSALLVRFFVMPHTSLLHSILVGVLVGSFGQMGDLIESFIKRDAGVKDSSNILPGHGGFLDRFDGPLVVAPLVYISMLIFGIG